MQSRQILLDWLNAAAARLRWQICLREGTRASACLLLLAACNAVFHCTIALPPVTGALQTLLLLCAIAVLVGFSVRMCRRPRLLKVAAAVDAQAGLNDALMSAHWFTTSAHSGPFIELHLLQVAQLTARLDPRALFPLKIPRKAMYVTLASLVVIGITGIVPVAVDNPETTPAVGSKNVAGAARNSTGSPATDVSRVTAQAAQKKASALWNQLAVLAGEFTRRPEGSSLSQAISRHDPAAAARALRSAQAVVSESPNAPGGQMTDTLAQGIIARLQELANSEQTDPVARRSGDASGTATARLEGELREEEEDAQRSAPRTQSPGEDALNTRLRALSRSSSAGRDAVHGEADSTDGAGRASVSGGAMGRRVGLSTAGAGDGDQPVGKLSDPAEGDSVLGRKTERLAVRLHAEKLQQGQSDEQKSDSEPVGTEETFVAATRAQAARVPLQSVGNAPSSAANSIPTSERPPPEYQEAVKRYTLSRHRRERDPNPAIDGVH